MASQTEMNPALAQMFAALAGNVADTSTEAPAKKKSLVWANVGMPMKLKDADGKIVTKRVTLPVNIAIDTMKPRPELDRVRTPAQKALNQEIKAQNKLLAMLQKIAEGMEEGGEAIDLSSLLTVTLERQFPQTDISDDNGEDEADIDAQFAAIADLLGKK